MRSGFVAIAGRPNVGKSTLLNAMVGQKVAITTPVPQTTRHAIRGVLHRPASSQEADDGVQIVFVDTPGMHKPKTLLGSRLNEVARRNLSEVDLVVFMADAAAGIGPGDRFIAGLLADVPTPAIAVANKLDQLDREAQLPVLAELDAMGDFEELIPLSAATGEGVDDLIDMLVDRLPEGPAWFPEEAISDQSTEQIVAEIIREKAIVRMREEVPHSVAVSIEEIVPGETEGWQVVHAVVYVERESQKGIVIGHEGVVLREIGAAARRELELVLGAQVWLDLRVKLMKEWQRDPKALQRLGY
ncbi:GTPase Era [Egibacter rhizosphaerae]|uniref:GTPase Era n=1 Tax=Egibacter rhizosphaerae TaxID=1670831 RepID=A0A411YBT4_9ACTN|nr:GTPase Era [Egibacter rhizosphaerae]QBI18622.1 GTPase Era [Egibacter rhizosphaerae]